jgi:hypothetical protein
MTVVVDAAETRLIGGRPAFMNVVDKPLRR